MDEILSNINGVAQLILTLTLVVGAVVAAVQGSRWGKAKAVQTAADLVALLRELAVIAVNATEQTYRKLPPAAGDAEVAGLRTEKLDAARGTLQQLLPVGMEASGEELDAAIEAAVHRLNEGKAP